MSGPILYLCGPMTGLPGNNYPAFHKAAADLRAAGYSVVHDRAAMIAYLQSLQ